MEWSTCTNQRFPINQRYGNRLGDQHLSTLQDIVGVLCVPNKHTINSVRDLKAQKIVLPTKVFDSELGMCMSNEATKHVLIIARENDIIYVKQKIDDRSTSMKIKEGRVELRLDVIPYENRYEITDDW